ncbi:hypothetical protein I314_06291 [Cryptococcus bacillisporus CA1873]|uniref:Uncharacterized protein n=1 Tax=Cryptococcus bacillisporus CA1873 TaxID=1296111 RepID=A0ABR5B3U4_CRYGA|nr:hypothetical protein I314_06291 [Cryptococcus bacillisporus CA1873]|eukprot:KIR57787.1 hypothetical protein I314_06291 [Cryptococcus gattii CA1873]
MPFHWFSMELVHCSSFTGRGAEGYGEAAVESVLVKVSNQWKKILVQPYERFSGHLPEELWEDAYQWVYVHWQEEKKQVGGSQRELSTDVSPAAVYILLVRRRCPFLRQTGKKVFWPPGRNENCSTHGCIEPGRAPTQQHETFQHYISTRAAFMEWYEEPKQSGWGTYRAYWT